MTTRSRLPEGFVAFRQDFGTIVRDARRGHGLSQQALAKAIGVTRETVSRMENGVLPLPDTLRGLMCLFGFDWSAFAVKGDSDRPAMRFDDSWRGEDREKMGRNLRKGRRLENLSLKEVAEGCGISAAQLSRLERGNYGKSRMVEYYPEDASLPAESRRSRFTLAELRRLEDVGENA